MARKAGNVVTEKNCRSVRPEYGLHTKYLPEVLGKKFVKDCQMGERFSLDCKLSTDHHDDKNTIESKMKRIDVFREIMQGILFA